MRQNFVDYFQSLMEKGSTDTQPPTIVQQLTFMEVNSAIHNDKILQGDFAVAFSREKEIYLT